MKKLLQNLRDGSVQIIDMPLAKIDDSEILIETHYSLMSPGTEKMLLEFGKSNWIERIKKNPDKVNQVINKIRNEGFMSAFETVQAKLNEPIELGYCNAGIIKEIGKNVKGLKVNDRVVSNSPHSEYVTNYVNCITKVPENVDLKSANFSILGAIALQGIRIANLSIGETVVVYGAGVIGLLTAQILNSTGYKVICLDIDKKKLELVKDYGAIAINVNNLNGQELLEEINDITNGIGVDAVILTLASTDKNIISNAAKISRKKGRIVLVGITNNHIDRSDFYEKELSFQVSCSYGPGRYDFDYEVKGIDYPLHYCRWTMKRNIEYVLYLISKKKILTDHLISKEYKFIDAKKAYKDVLENNNITISFDYEKNKSIQQKPMQIKEYTNIQVLEKNFHKSKTLKEINIGIIGSGSYCGKVILPNLSTQKNIKFETIISKNGKSSSLFGKKYNFKNISTEINDVLNNDKISTVFITTRHDTHADILIKCLKKNKNIFLEKPLCINIEQHRAIANAYEDSRSILFMGYNRRFSSFTSIIKKLLNETSTPKNIQYTINATRIDKQNWIKDRNIGGGRLIGEVCHFLDYTNYLIGKNISTYSVLSNVNDIDDNLIIQLKYNDNSLATINYLTNGSQKYQKENIRIFCSGKIIELDNFKKIKTYGFNKEQNTSFFRQDKGQYQMISNFLNDCQNCKSSISFEDILNVSKITLQLEKEINS